MMGGGSQPILFLLLLLGLLDHALVLVPVAGVLTYGVIVAVVDHTQFA